MSFTSQLYGNEFIIDEDTPSNAPALTPPPGYSKGYVKRDYRLHPYNSIRGTTLYTGPLIPRNEWDARIEEKERTKARLSDLVLNHNPYIPSKDQNGTNYCWFNGLITATETLMAFQGHGYVALSSACGAAQIKNFRNYGGWGGDAIAWLVEHGTCPESMWPNAAIDRRYLTPAVQAIMPNYRVTEWWELEENNFDMLMTMLLLDFPVGLGLDWWSHLICGMDGVVLGRNTYGVRIRNSWSDDYGEKGFAVLTEPKSRGDGNVPRQIIAYHPGQTLPALAL